MSLSAHSFDRATAGIRYERAFDAAPTGVAITEATASGGARYVEVNREFARLFGYEPDDMAGMSILDVTHPGDIERSRDVTQRFFRGDLFRVVIEKRYVRRDGSVFWGFTQASVLLDDDGEPVGAIAHVEDITARKRAESDVRRHREQLELSQRQAGIATFEVRPDTGDAKGSHELYRIIGRDPSEGPLSTREWLELVHPEDRAVVRSAARQWQRPHLIEYRFFRPDGRLIVLEQTAAPVTDDDALPAGVVGTLRDISAQRAAEHALHAAERLTSALETSPLAHLLVAVGGPSARIVWANAAAATLAGREPGSLPGLSLASLADGGALPAQLEAVLRNARPAFIGELRLAQADGCSVTVDARAQVVGDGAHALILLAPPEPLPGQQGGGTAALSARERQILALVAAGLGGREIAEAANLSAETVKTHLRRIYLKLGVNDRAAAVAAALRQGIIR